VPGGPLVEAGAQFTTFGTRVPGSNALTTRQPWRSATASSSRRLVLGAVNIHNYLCECGIWVKTVMHRYTAQSRRFHN
jgi:hypothetical protein